METTILHVPILEMETCKAIIQEGPRKGNKCKFPPSDGYCGRHLRNKIYDEGISSGKKWCRFFFRGCDSEITGNESSCNTCRDKLTKKQLACEHEGCKFKVLEGKFCKKHERDIYRLEEIQKNIKYCDIDRGCFTILDKKASCDTCLEKRRVADNEMYKQRKEIIKAAQRSGNTTRSCMTCAKDFEAFNTRYLVESVNCKQCLEKQSNQDNKRDRIRNYKEEHARHLDSYYKSYISDSRKRGHGDFQIDFETFTELVTDSCYYCKYKHDSETNGIDRVDNSIGYTKENCVTACWKCNRMKQFYHPAFFIEKCKIILKELAPTESFYTKWNTYYTRSNYRNYTNYKKVAETERQLPFELSQQQWDWLTRSPCYLCGYQDAHGIGIDRFDNTIRKYTIENSRPCCGSCNSMKGEIEFQEFLDQCKAISTNWPNTDNFSNHSITNPLKEAEADLSNRKHWKAEGLYYAILSKNTAFLEHNKSVYTEKEFKELSNTILGANKETAIDILKTLIKKLKKRKLRLSPAAIQPAQ